MISIQGVALLLTMAMPQQQYDTTVAVRPGTRLLVDAGDGSVAIRTWDRNSVRVSAEYRSRIRIAGQRPIEVRAGAGRVSVRTQHAWTENGHVDYQISVPEWMDVKVDARNAGVQVTGGNGEVAVETLNGAIEIRGGRGLVSASSVGGSINIAGARGRVTAETVNQGIRATDVEGDLKLSTTNGGIVLVDIRGRSVEAETVNGAVRYEGQFADGGFYRLATHNGSVVLAVPRLPDAKLTVSTFNGSFESDFPLQLNSVSGSKTFSFTIGSGSARVDIESFNGTIRLVRSGSDRRRQ